MFKKWKLNTKKIEFYPWSETTDEWGSIPLSASTKIPDWYKKIRPYGEDNSYSQLKKNVTLKICMPFLDAMTAGYVVTLSNDIIVEKTEEGQSTINWPYGGNLVETHKPGQIALELVPKGYVNLPFKWLFNYGVKLPKGYSLWVTHPVNRNDLPFLTITGFVDADKYNHPINFPFFLRDDFFGIIEAGTPIAQLIPIKRDSWSSIKKKYNKSFIINGDKPFYAFAVKGYKRLFWSRKSYN